MDPLLFKMTLENKIGQISQVLHFAYIADEIIGSEIHTKGPAPGEDATEWQSRI